MREIRECSVAVVGGAGCGAGSIDFTSGPPASARFIHALRVEADSLADGGLTADRIIGYRTQATPETDGGLDLQDIGPADCTGDTSALRAWAFQNCRRSLADGGVGPRVQDIRVIEVRPSAEGMSIEVYGDAIAVCRMPKPAILRTLLDSLQCNQRRHRSSGAPL